MTTTPTPGFRAGVIPLAEIEAALIDRDWSWELNHTRSRDGEWLFNFRISDWTGRERDESAVIHWGTASTIGAAVKTALEKLEKSKEAMG